MAGNDQRAAVTDARVGNVGYMRTRTHTQSRGKSGSATSSRVIKTSAYSRARGPVASRSLFSFLSNIFNVHRRRTTRMIVHRVRAHCARLISFLSFRRRPLSSLICAIFLSRPRTCARSLRGGKKKSWFQSWGSLAALPDGIVEK